VGTLGCTHQKYFNSAEPLDEIPEITQENAEKLSQLEKYEKDPNKFIYQAETLLNSSTIEKFNKTTGHTPSVIGAQEVYRDPRMKMMAQKKAEEEERKSSVTKQRDGAKLSFQEKMELFRKESGDANGNKDKAKISKAQREIGDDPNAPALGSSPISR
jgi:afadin